MLNINQPFFAATFSKPVSRLSAPTFGIQFPDEVRDVEDLRQLTAALQEGTGSMAAALNAVYILAFTEPGLIRDLGATCQYRDRVAQEQAIPAAKALAAFFSTVAQQLENPRS